MSTAVVERQTDLHVDGYLWIPLAAVRVPNFARVDLFSFAGGSGSPALIHSARLALGAEQISQLERQNLNRVLVRKSDLQQISVSVQAELDNILQDVRIPIGERFELLQIATWAELEHNARKIYCERFVENAQHVGKLIAELLGANPISANELYGHTLHDDSNAVHLTNVAACSVLLAAEMKERDFIQLTKIAVGAILHEFGKIFLPLDLLQKPGRLSIQERELLERAPHIGYEKLCERPDLEFGQLMMIYQQHERYDGSGYPVAIENDEIHPWARILAVVDVFDTMISRKAYRSESRIGEALLYVADNSSQHFDPKVVQCWLTVFQQH